MKNLAKEIYKDRVLAFHAFHEGIRPWRASESLMYVVALKSSLLTTAVERRHIFTEVFTASVASHDHLVRGCSHCLHMHGQQIIGAVSIKQRPTVNQLSNDTAHTPHINLAICRKTTGQSRRKTSLLDC